MKKIPTLFIRDPNNMGLVTREVNPECQWVIEGEGKATVKIDGTACLWKDGKLWKRYTVKKGRTPPADFIPTGEPSDLGKQPGWTAVGDKPEDKHHQEALANTQLEMKEGQTYELIGPKVQGNPHGAYIHELCLHGAVELRMASRDFDGLKNFLAFYESYEGIVWHHPDGRMAKIKRKDFGLPWPVTREKDS